MTMPLTRRAALETGEVAGRPVVLRYDDVADEYAALHRGALVFDRSHRGRLRLSGPKAGEMLTGLVTNDVLALAPGEGLYAAALTAKGKIVADVRVFAEAGSVLTDVPARAADAWLAMVKRFINPRLAPYRDESATLHTLGVYGANARQIVAQAFGVEANALAELPMYGHLAGTVDGAAATVARVPELGTVEGYDVFVPAEQFDTAWARAVAAGARPGGLLAWEIARVEAGRPEWGLDIDDTTIPQEANFDDLHAISYTKGCYVGQETVARLHFRGHVNKLLHRVRIEATAAPPPKTPLFDSTGKSVGELRSAVVSPSTGTIGIAMVRREVAPGSRLTAVWEQSECAVELASAF